MISHPQYIIYMTVDPKTVHILVDFGENKWEKKKVEAGSVYKGM